MRRWIALVLAAALTIWQAPLQAQGRVYSQAELDALLAPVALYPDPVLSNILVAATYPDDLREAAAWSRANSRLTGEDALRAAEPMLWQPSVKALVAFPDLLARMDESPQWTADLGAAFRGQEPYVMDTVQALRRRAEASGYLQNTPQQQVYEQEQAISIYPAQPQVMSVPYYDPYVVYGPWWSPYRPVFWRPWFAAPVVFVSTNVFVTRVDWRRRHVLQHVNRFQPHVQPIRAAVPVTIHNHAQPVRPIVDSVRAVRPIGVPVQPEAQPRQPQVRREFQREREARVSPPVIVQRPAQVVRPIVDSVRIHSNPRPIVGSVRIQQPHQQRFQAHQQRFQQRSR